MDPLIDLKFWPTISENPQEREKNKRLDKEFKEKGENATPEKTQEMQDEAWDIFWKNFSPEKNIIHIEEGDTNANEVVIPEVKDVISYKDILDPSSGTPLKTEALTESQNIEQIELWTLEDSPLAPILKSLSDSWYINNDTYKATIESLKETDNDEKAVQIIKTLVSGIVNLGQKEKDDILKNVIWGEEVTKDNFKETDFYHDMQAAESWAKPEWSSLDLLLAENYFKLPNRKPEEDLIATMDVALNKIIKKQGLDFKENHSKEIAEIRAEPNFGKKHSQLEKLNELNITTAGIWGKKTEGVKEKIEEGKDTEKLTIEEKFYNFKELLKKSIENDKNNENLEILLKEANVLKEEYWIKGEWEIFSLNNYDDIKKLVDIIDEKKEKQKKSEEE